ncbi:MAG: PilW family protein [Zoogloeaceae bacterium]|jgi:type IV pilus assembly protein PilW|nr:PilW family protein [Zoogloeaceae bacterium]
MKNERVFAFAGREDRARGFSLVELMVSMAIGLIVLSAVFYSYIGGRSSYRLNEEIARLQENGRVVMDMLEKDLRMASYSGCSGLGRLRARGELSAIRNGMRVGVYADKIPGTVLGEEAYSLRVVAPVLETGIAADVSAGSPSVVLTDWSEDIGQGAAMGIYDCGAGELFRIDAVSGSDATVTLDAAPTRDVSAEIGRVFVLRKNGADDADVGTLYDIVDVEAPGPGGGTVGALRRNGEELLTGVEAFRVCLGRGNAYGASYGESQIDGYSRAEAVDTDTERERVVSVQVDLLLASTSSVALEVEETQSFSLCGGDDFTRTDRRLRKLFSTTVSLRNKLK